jgi:hypothetical protein
MFLYVHNLFHNLLSCDKIMDPWNVCMYICMYKSYKNSRDKYTGATLDLLV